MKYMDKVAVIGLCEGKSLLGVLNLNDEQFNLKQIILDVSDKQDIAIHSLLSCGNFIYLADSFHNKVYKVNIYSNEIDEANVGRDPRHMCLSNGNLYVSNFESDNISIIELDNFNLTGSFPTGIKPHDIKVKDNNIYISCYEENIIIQYGLVDGNKRYFYMDSKPMHLYLLDDIIITMNFHTNGDANTQINFINLNSNIVEGIINIEGISNDIDVDESNKRLYLLNIVDKFLYIIDITERKIQKKIFLGGYSESLTVGENYIYVTNSKKNQILIIDKETFTIKNIDLSFTPDCIKVIY